MELNLGPLAYAFRWRDDISFYSPLKHAVVVEEPLSPTPCFPG